MSVPKRTVLQLAACSAALLLALTGCSSASEPAPTAKDSGGTAAISDAEQSAKLLAWERDLAQCFRDNGLAVTDPTPEGGWEEVTAEMQALSPKCQEEIGEAPVKERSAAEQAAMEQTQFEYQTRFTACMRELGYEMADPKLGAAGELPPADASEAELQQCDVAAAE